MILDVFSPHMPTFKFLRRLREIDGNISRLIFDGYKRVLKNSGNIGLSCDLSEGLFPCF